MAESGEGASEWASGSHVCIGAMPAFVPKPTEKKYERKPHHFGVQARGRREQHRPVKRIVTTP